MTSGDRYRKKPVVVRAWKWTGDVYQFAAEGAPIPGPFIVEGATGQLLIDTLEGTMTADIGDWVIQGIKGEFYPCKPDIFAATYELAGRDDE